MDRRSRTGRRGRSRRYKIPLPKICYIFIFGEAFFFSAWVIVRYVAMIYPPTRCFSDMAFNVLYYRLSSLAGGFAGLILCCLAEAVWGKYAFMYVFTGASIPSAVACWLIIPRILPSNVQGYLCETLFFTEPLFAASYPLRIAMISLQLPLPQHKKNVRKFYFYHWITSYGLLALLSLVSFRGYETDSLRFWRGVIVCTVVSLGLIGYLLAFIIVRKHLVKLFRKRGIVTNELKCLMHGMKYLCKYNWLEYTADKCSVETIENTTQLLNMMLVFTSFSMYYANDQHLENHFAVIYTMSAKLGILKYTFFNDIYYIATVFFLVFVELALLPLIRKLKIKTSVLRLIGVGIAFQVSSVILAHALQTSVYSSKSPEPGNGQLRIYNAIDYGSSVETKWKRLTIDGASLYRENEIAVSGTARSFINIHNFLTDLFITSEIEVHEQQSTSYVIAPNLFYKLKDKNLELQRIEEVHEISEPLLRFICPLENKRQFYAWCNATVHLVDENRMKHKYSVLDEMDGRYSSIPQGNYQASFTINGQFAFSSKSQTVILSEGGIYTVLLYEDYSKSRISFKILTQLDPFILSQWVWTMIVLRAFGTALAAVSSYTFTFIQAPPDMRTTLWGLHFFFENFGNLLLVGISFLTTHFYRNIAVAVVFGSISFALHIFVSSHFQYVNYYIF